IPCVMTLVLALTRMLMRNFDPLFPVESRGPEYPWNVHPGLRRGDGLFQRFVDGLAGVQQLLDGVHRDLEVALGLIVQRYLDNLLDAARTDHGRHADIKAVDTIFAVD